MGGIREAAKIWYIRVRRNAPSGGCARGRGARTRFGGPPGGAMAIGPIKSDGRRGRPTGEAGGGFVFGEAAPLVLIRFQSGGDAPARRILEVLARHKQA